MPTFKLDEAVNDSLGGVIKNLNPDGTVQVSYTDPKTGEEREQRFDHIRYMRDLGVDPSKVDIRYNTPETAADTADLSFASKVKMALAGTEQDQIRQLKKQFGDSEVMEGQDGPVVREAGVWKKADGSFLASLTASIPEMSAGIAGRIAGGALGATLGPVGAVGGAWVGGAAASAIAHVVKDLGAEKLGLRSEYDAQTASDTLKTDLVVNLAFDAVLGAGGAVVRGQALPAIKAGSKALSRGLGSAVKAVAGEDKAAAATMFSQLVPDTKPQDWMTVMRSADDAVNIQQDIKAIQVWENLPPGVRPDASPVQQSMAEVAEQAMRGARASSGKLHASALEEIGGLANLDHQNVSVAQVGASFRNKLAAMGVLDIQNGIPVIAKRPTEDGARIMQVFDPKSLNTLNKVLAQLNTLRPVSAAADATTRLGTTDRTAIAKAGGKLMTHAGEAELLAQDQTMGQMIGKKVGTLKPNPNFATEAEVPYKPGQGNAMVAGLSSIPSINVERKLSFNQTKAVLNGIDDILESSGYYKGSEMAISNNARSALKGLRAELNDTMIQGLGNQSDVAAKLYRDEAARSHAFLNFYEDFAVPSKLGGNDQKMVNTVMRMFGGTQDLDKASFRQMMTAARVDANAYVSRLEQLNAANNLYPVVAGKGITGAAKSMLGMSPNSMAQALSDQTIKAGRTAVAQATPASPWAKRSVEAWGRAKNYVDELKPLDKKNLMSNPVLLREFLATVIQAGQPPVQTSQP